MTARILTGTRKCCHITILESLHWLRFCIDFKIMILTCKALYVLAQHYLSELLINFLYSKSALFTI